MQLIVDGRFVEDPWADRSGDDAMPSMLGAIDEGGNLDIILSLVHAMMLDISAFDGARSARLGVRLESHADLTSVIEWLPYFSLIAVTFASSADGRGFSLARQLRHYGFRGELRASGPLIVDQYALALACGFDSVEIPRALALRQPADQWRQAQRQIGQSYQPGYRSACSVLEARHRVMYQ